MEHKNSARDLGLPFFLLALVIPPLAVLAPLALSWVPGLSALWIAILHMRHKTLPWTQRSWHIPVACTGLIVYGALTYFWSLSPDRTLHIATKLIPMLVGGWLLVDAAFRLDNRARDRAATGFAVGSVIAFALIAIEIVTGGLLRGILQGNGFQATNSVIHLNRAASLIAILIWPLWLVLDRRFGTLVAAGTIAVAAIALFHLDPDTPVVTLVAGIAFFALAYAKPRFAGILLTAGILIVALAMPLYPLLLPAIEKTLAAWNISDFTLRHRFAIWDFAASRAADQPLWGWGLGASRIIPDAGVIDHRLNSIAENLPLHPHNALLQMWLELGIPGVLFAVGAMLTIIVRTKRLFDGRKEQATALTVIFTATLIAEMNYGIWQSWWLVFLWALAALTIVIARPRSIGNGSANAKGAGATIS